MRKIEVRRWKALVPNSVTKEKPEGEAVEENTLMILTGVMNRAEHPKGFDNFMRFHRLAIAIEKADKSGILELEEAEYTYLKDLVQKNIPAEWGANLSVNEAIEAFMDTKEE